MEKERNTHIDQQGHRSCGPSNAHTPWNNVSRGNLAESLLEILVADRARNLRLPMEASL